MILTERKLKILYAIINDYIATAEPIGSRTIAKKYDIGISSATIRNEMSDLEELGLIIQPHTSSGRIPSDKGYRLYVNSLLNNKNISSNKIDFINEIIKRNIDNIDFLMQETAKAISYITNYTTLVSEPDVKNLKLKHIQLMPLSENSVVAAIITESKIIRNFTIKMKDVPDYEILSRMSNILNNLFSGVLIDRIDLEEIKNNLLKSGKEGELILSIFDDILKAIFSESDIEVFTTGVKNILTFPEFSDVKKAKSVVHALEEKDVLNILVGRDQFDENVEIIIGAENIVEEIKDCSIIKTGYKIGNKISGTIGILGPTRMDYSQVISLLKAVEIYINNALNDMNRN